MKIDSRLKSTLSAGMLTVVFCFIIGFQAMKNGDSGKATYESGVVTRIEEGIVRVDIKDSSMDAPNRGAGRNVPFVFTNVFTQLKVGDVVMIKHKNGDTRVTLSPTE